MTLNQALAVINSRKAAAQEKKVTFLACGFEPLHLKTFLHAALLNRLPVNGVEILTGVYGDLTGNLVTAAESASTAAIVVIEWSDVDPRLGLRSSSGWSAEVKSDIAVSCVTSYRRLESAIGKLAAVMPVVVMPPTLPMVPIGNTISAQSSVLELELQQEMSAFLLRIASVAGVRVVNSAQLQQFGFSERLDPKMELLAGFPYTASFASALAELAASVLHQPAPKKGLITDLDDTLWAGLVGEVGVDGVSWQQEQHTQVHGLYQQMLGHLASCGVLLGVCSRNQQTTVEAALAREDLFLSAESLYPVHANWQPKSLSVAKILDAWNIHQDAVVFVDDSPMELAEVKQAFPDIVCLQFHPKDPAKTWSLLAELRDLFGKPWTTEEDGLRQASLRSSAQISAQGEHAGSPEFLATLNGTLTIEWHADAADKRAFELMNKTNQFNLNGLRIDEGEWQRMLTDPRTVVGVISYSDKFGPLGRIGVLVGMVDGIAVRVKHWVMSCRAFSRRIEHHTLASLFQHSSAERIEFDFRITDRNQPLREFLATLGVGAENMILTKADFAERRVGFPHQVRELAGQGH